MPPIRLGISVDLTRNVVDSFTLVSAPVITGNPTISGTIRTGQTLTASPASVSGSPTPTRTWQWVRAGVDIAGATAQTYTLTNLDEGRNITVRQTETNGSGSVNATSSATAVPFLLDQLTATAVAAYSLRKLRDGANLATRIRRNDAAEQDFGFLADGQFDYAAYNTFLGAGSGTGRTWYDQTTNAVNYEQTDALRQPRIRLSGVDFTVGAKPAWSFEGSGTSVRWWSRTPFLFNGGAASASFALRSTNPGNTQGILSERNGAAGNGGAEYTLRRESGGNLGFEVRNDAGTQTAISQQIVSNAFDGNVNIVSFRDSGSLARGLRDGNPGINLSYSRGAGPYTFTNHLLGGNYVFGGSASFIPVAEAIYFSSDISNEDMNTIIASQGGEYGSAVVPFLEGEELEFFGRTRDGLFGEFNTNWEGYTASMGSNDTPNSGTVGFPPLFRRVLSATTGQANRITTGLDELNNFNTFGPDLYIGGTCRVYRTTNGVMSLVRTSTVTDAKIGRWNWQRFTTDGNADNRVIDGTSYRFDFDTFNRPNVPYWFRVAAVGSNGLSGAWSDPVAYTPTAVNGAANNVANTPRSFNRTGSGGALAAPAGLAVVAGNSPRVASMTWGAVAGAEGYIVEMSYYDPATQIVSAPYLELASDPTAILPTDLVIFERQFLTLGDNLYSTRVFNAATGSKLVPGLFWFESDVLKRDSNDWSYVAYSGDKPARAFGDHFLRRTANAGRTAQLQRFWHSGTDQSFYTILAPGTTYRMRIVMRTSVPTTVTLATNSPVVSGTTFSVGTTFAEYTYDMTPTGIVSGSSPYDWRLQITAGGTPINLDVAFFEIETVGAISNILAASPAPQNTYLRDHSFIKFPPKGYTVPGIAETTNYGFKRFHDTLLANGSKPWFQLEWNIPKEDILNFVAYLAAPNGAHPMSTIRQASGIAQPWTTTFANSIKFEPGNEGWNTQGDFWLFPFSMTDAGNATVYSQGNIAGLFWQMVTNWMKESPYWSILAPHLTMHCGGWAVNTWGEDAYRYFPDAKEVSIAAYNGGWDNGTELVAEKGISFNGLLADSLINQKPRGLARVNALKALCTSLGRNYGTDIRYTIYEGGPGYQFNGLNGASVTAAQAIEQEVVMKSRAAAASTVDSMLTYAQQDFLGFNFFQLGSGGQNWNSHSRAGEGGQEFPTHALVRIIHENIAPARVWGGATQPIGTKAVTLQGGGTSNINQIGAYQLRNIANPSKRMIVLINRNIDPSQLPVSDPLYSATPSGTVAFNVTTTWNSASSLRIWTAGVGPYRQHNRYPVGQRRAVGGGFTSDPLSVAFDYSSQVVSVPSNIKNFPVNASIGAASGGLPAGSCLILLFEGVT